MSKARAAFDPVVGVDTQVSETKDLPTTRTLVFDVAGNLGASADKENITFVMSMHRLGLARQFGDDVLALRDGEIVPGFIGNEKLETPQAEVSL